tara:strand:+ start:884 stop:1156 length:273 start_codon:yes stop_codon:yes gene_type:complete
MAIIIKRENAKISLLDLFKINIAGQAKREMHIKLKEYVPIIDNICIKFIVFEKLNAIKFQGKPVKMKPLNISIIPNKVENIKNETTTFFE